MRSLVCFLILMVFAMTAAFSLPAYGQRAKAESSASETGNVIATYDGAKVSIDDINLMMKYRLPGEFRFFRGRSLEQVPSEQREELVKTLVGYSLIADKAKSEGTTLSPERKDQLERYKKQLLIEFLMNKKIVDTVDSISDEEAKKFYEENKEKFSRPFEFEIKQILLLTYDEYEVKEGDTLESIAANVTKDPSALDDIRDPNSFEPRYVKPENREKILFKPLHPGEKVLVPVSKEKQEALKKQIQDIYNELKNDADFDDLAEKYSKIKTSSRIVPSTMAKQPHENLITAAEKTAVGEYSEPFETNVGYRIIKVINKKEKEYIPFDQVKQWIINRQTGQKRGEAAEDFVRDLFQKSPSVKLYPEVLEDDKASSTAVVAEIDDVKVTKGEFSEKLENFIEPGMPPKKQLEEIIRIPEVSQVILSVEAKRLKIEEGEDYKKAAQQAEIYLLAEQYLNNLYEKQIDISEENLKKYYTENIDKYTIPRQFKIRQIRRDISPNLSSLSDEQRDKAVKEKIAEMTEIRKKIQNLDDFIKMAAEYSQDTATKDNGGDLGYMPESYREGFGGRVQTMNSGEISEPFEYGAFVYIIMIEDIKEPQQEPYDKVRENVERTYRFNKQDELRKQLITDLLSSAHFKYIKSEDTAEEKTQ